MGKRWLHSVVAAAMLLTTVPLAALADTPADDALPAPFQVQLPSPGTPASPLAPSESAPLAPVPTPTTVLPARTEPVAATTPVSDGSPAASATLAPAPAPKQKLLAPGDTPAVQPRHPATGQELLTHALVLASLFALDDSLTNSFQAHGFPGLSESAGGKLFSLGNGVPEFAMAEAWRWIGHDDTANQAGATAARAILNAGLNVQVLKTLFGRGNPGIGPGSNQWVGPRLIAGHDSFPSGHTAAAFSFATAMAHYYPRQRKWYYGLAGLIGISTLAVHVHFPSDVYAGALLGIISGNEAIHRDPNLLFIRF